MSDKTITITLEAYEALKRLKKPGESFRCNIETRKETQELNGSSWIVERRR